MMADVPKADVVVTNPTHYAVALRYDESKSAARAGGHRPDRGQDPRAGGRTQDSHIGSAAARALHQHVELGQEIPAELYTAVAEVLAWVFQLRSWRAGWGPSRPRRPPACAGRAGPASQDRSSRSLNERSALHAEEQWRRARADPGRPHPDRDGAGHDGVAAAHFPARPAVHLQHRAVGDDPAGGMFTRKPLDFAAFRRCCCSRRCCGCR